MEKNNNTVGARIRECRKAKGYSQDQLAEILLTSKMTISNYENDKYDLGSTTLKLVADALDTTVAYLVDGFIAPSSKEQEILNLIHSLKSEQMKDIAIAQLKVLVDMQEK